MVKIGIKWRRNRGCEGAKKMKTLPNDLILEILYRIPVKDLMRFRCVSKSWLALILDPAFVYMHINRNKDSFRILVNGCTHSINNRFMGFVDLKSMSILFKLKSLEPLKIGYPTGFNFSNFASDMVFSGSVNGIVCLSYYGQYDGFEWGAERIVLWNPAINCCKSILLSARNFVHDNSRWASVGLGFDADARDYKIIRIVPVDVSQSSTEDVMSRVEIYSDNRDCWEDGNDGALIPFYPGLRNCNVIIKGVPYWEYRREGGLIVIDPCTGMYRKIPYPKYVVNQKTSLKSVNLMDSVAVLIHSPGVEVNDLVDVYVLDDSCDYWMKKYTIGPIQCRFWLPQFLVTGQLVAQKSDSNYHRHTTTFFYDPITDHLSTEFDAFEPFWFESYRHVDSLVFLKGMEPLDRENKKNWDEFLSKGFKFVKRFLLKSESG